MTAGPRSWWRAPALPPVALGLAAAALAILMAGMCAGCVPSSAGLATPTADPLSKIALPLDDINADGLVGAAGALRALDYEFCIPADEASVREVQTIDPRVRVMRGSRGRIGCSSAEFLCVNNTHAPGWRDTLLRLAALPYIRRIQQTDWE